MATTTTKNYRMLQKKDTDEYLLLHPETDASVVLTSSDAYAATDVESALEELAGSISDLGTNVTDTTYTKTEIDETVAALEATISAIPIFDIEVVTELPTADISESTIYLVKTSETETGNLYTEYIYIDGDWESLGTQTLDLSDYAKTVDIEDGTTVAGIAAKLGTSTVGSGTNPIYLSSGTATASSSTIGGIAQPVYLNAGTITAIGDGSNAVGSSTKPVYLAADGTITASSSTVGSGTKPVYLSSGTITASSSTIGSGTKPVYLSSGTVTASTSTVGSTSAPVYLSSGTLTACASVAASTADVLAEARTVALEGDVTASGSFDGSEDITLTATLASSGVSAGTYTAVTVNEKGLATAGAYAVEVGSTGQTEPSSTLASGGLFFLEI